MLGKEYEGQICSIARSLELVGERWTLLVIREVFNGNRKFSEMQRSLGVARNVLTDRLQGLLDEGILERRPTASAGALRVLPDREGPRSVAADDRPDEVGGQARAPPGGRPMVVVHKGECGGEIDDRRICTSAAST